MVGNGCEGVPRDLNCGSRPRKGAGRPDAEGKVMSSSVGMKRPIEGEAKARITDHTGDT